MLGPTRNPTIHLQYASPPPSQPPPQQQQDVHRLPSERPGLYAKALRLALALASDAATAEPLARLLLPGESAEGLLPLLGQLLLAPLPPLAPPAPGTTLAGGVHAVVSALRQRAYILRWYALALYSVRRRDIRAPILATLFAPPGGDVSSLALADGAALGYAPGDMGGGGGAAAAALAAVVGLSVAEPSIKDLPAEELRVAEEMVVADVSVRALLTGPQVRLGGWVGQRASRFEWLSGSSVALGVVASPAQCSGLNPPLTTALCPRYTSPPPPPTPHSPTPSRHPPATGHRAARARHHRRHRAARL